MQSKLRYRSCWSSDIKLEPDFFIWARALENIHGTVILFIGLRRMGEMVGEERKGICGRGGERDMKMMYKKGAGDSDLRFVSVLYNSITTL